MRNSIETVYEREFLSNNKNVPLSGFTSRSINRLVKTKQPVTMLRIEANHLKRDIKRSENNIVPLLEYELWLEAGKLDKANFKSKQADKNLAFNSNVWRNFRSYAGLNTNTSLNVPEAICTLYPINVPAPSNLATNNLSQYYEQNKLRLFKSEKTYDFTKAKVDKDAALMKFLRLKSEVRNPPLDSNGNIIPPRNFKKYPVLFQDSNQTSPVTTAISKSDHQLLPRDLSLYSARINAKPNSTDSNFQFIPNKRTPSTKINYREQYHKQNKKILLEEQKSKKSFEENFLISNTSKIE